MMRTATVVATCLVLLLAFASPGLGQHKSDRPNIVLIMTDDQGHGDLGFHGNPVIRTPHLDKFAKQSVRLKNFHVSPVCSPTRSSLLTGRYNYRTGVVDTFLGRSMMYPDEVTLAELLSQAGYRTGIFGKWHLGDCYPMRAMDQGFQESLVHTGGGIGQPSDPPGNSYFDPVLLHKGKEIKSKGYCSDIFTDAAMNFISKNKDSPFFVYLAYNAPHAPYQVPQNYYALYKGKDLSQKIFPALGHPIMGKVDQDETAKVYGMITNIDDNVGRLLAHLDQLKLSGNTIVIFLTDNGPGSVRYNSGMLGRKGTVHEGGTHVPCFIRWPAHLAGDRDVENIAAHIDLTPTLLEACGVQRSAKIKMDGMSLLPLLIGGKVGWQDRNLFFQWHRGDEPEMYRACAVRNQKYRLVQPLGGGEGKMPTNAKFQLFDLVNDPFTMLDIADQNPQVVAKMKKAYETWFKDVRSTRNFVPPPIYLGAKEQNPVVLTRQDWRGPKASWGPTGLGYWDVKVVSAGKFNLTIQFSPQPKERTIHLVLGKVRRQLPVAPKGNEVTFEGVELDEGPGRLEAYLTQGNQEQGVQYVIVSKLP